MIRVTRHAIERYQQRVAKLSDEQTKAAILSPAVILAAAFGARFVRLAPGHRIAIRDNTITTVLPPEDFRKQVLREGLPRFGANSKVGRNRNGRSA